MELNRHAILQSEIVATLREGLIVLSEDLRVEYASARFLTMFGVARDETVGQPLASLGNGQWNIPPLLDALGVLAAENATLENFEVEHRFDGIGRKVMQLNARKTVRPGDGARMILLAIEDVTEAVDHARELGRLRRLSDGIVDTLREPLLVLDGDMTVLIASRAFYRTFGVSADDTIGRKLDALGNGQWANADLLHLLHEVIPENITIDDYEITHDFPGIGTRTFTLNARKIFREGNNTRTLLLAMEDVTEWRRAEQERSLALARTDRMLEELNHRVMNSMAMIGSVIAMEGRALSDDECRAAFTRMRNRINSIGTLYRNLSRSAAVDNVNADDYLGTILRDMVGSVETSPGAIAIELTIPPLELSTRIAVPLGLIVNELVTNSLKYAYVGRESGRLGLSLSSVDGGFELSIWDDGPGIDAHARVDSGLGQRLVESFVEQLGASLSRSSGPDGTRHVLIVPLAGSGRG